MSVNDLSLSLAFAAEHPVYKRIAQTCLNINYYIALQGLKINNSENRRISERIGKFTIGQRFGAFNLNHDILSDIYRQIIGEESPVMLEDHFQGTLMLLGEFGGALKVIVPYLLLVGFLYIFRIHFTAGNAGKQRIYFTL